MEKKLYCRDANSLEAAQDRKWEAECTLWVESGDAGKEIPAHCGWGHPWVGDPGFYKSSGNGRDETVTSGSILYYLVSSEEAEKRRYLRKSRSEAPELLSSGALPSPGSCNTSQSCVFPGVLLLRIPFPWDTFSEADSSF